ncbi:TonB-dependent receptor [Sphingomonas sp. TX0543]|uniref:TonB-dependent receptor n=1 Tax=unclassified Sphingomonas TaxID=196159 RepID=UPI001485077B|nr:TonB-dependent receptor [Sphingomonas sp. 3P27F8]
MRQGVYAYAAASALASLMVAGQALAQTAHATTVEGPPDAAVPAGPVAWFDAKLSFGWPDAKYDEVGAGLAPRRTLPITLASRFAKAPEWTVRTGAEVRHNFSGGGRAAFGVDCTRYSRIFHDVANSPIIADDGYRLLNARVNYTLPNDQVTLSLFGTDLTKTLYLVSGNVLPAFGVAEASYGRSREWGVSAA